MEHHRNQFAKSAKSAKLLTRSVLTFKQNTTMNLFTLKLKNSPINYFKLILLFITVLVSLNVNSQNLIQNPKINPNFTFPPLNDDFNNGYGAPWVVANQTPDLSSTFVSSPTAAFCGAFSSTVYEGLYSNRFQLQLGKSYVFGAKMASKSGSMLDSIVVQIVDTFYKDGISLPSFGGSTGRNIIHYNFYNSNSYSLFDNCFIADSSDCDSLKKLWISAFTSDTDNRGGLLFDDVELIPNFEFLQTRNFSTTCGATPLYLGLIDKQVPFINFTPSYFVYDITGGAYTYVGTSLSFTTRSMWGTIKQYQIIRDLGLGSGCYGYDTVTINIEPIKTSFLISSDHPSKKFCDGDAVNFFTVVPSYDGKYYWTFPDGTKTTTTGSSAITCSPAQEGWYKLTMWIDFSSLGGGGCYFGDSVYYTKLLNHFIADSVVVPCSINTSLNGDVNFDPADVPTYEWYILGSGTIIDTARFHTVNINTRTVYVVKRTLGASPFCISYDTLIVNVGDAYQNIIELVQRSYCDSSILILKCNQSDPSAFYDWVLPDGSTINNSGTNDSLVVTFAHTGWYYLRFSQPPSTCYIYDSIYLKYAICDCKTTASNVPFDTLGLTRNFEDLYYEIQPSDTNYFKNANLIIGVSLYVPPGLKFTISNCNIKMRECSKIIVGVCAELKIEFTKIGGCKWQGIEVWGNDHWCPLSTFTYAGNGGCKQGKLILKHDTILDADIGVFLGKRSYHHGASPPSFAGGILQADSNYFGNNAYDIVFEEYTNDYLCGFPYPNGDPSCPDQFIGADIYQTFVSHNTFGTRAIAENCSTFVHDRMLYYNSIYGYSVTDFHIMDFSDERLSPTYSTYNSNYCNFCDYVKRNKFSNNTYANGIGASVPSACSGLYPPFNNSYY